MPNPDLASQFTVNPAALEGCGQSAQHIAQQVPGETAKIVGPSDQASAALKGWRTAGALHDCSANWKTLLDRLSVEMAGCGTRLVQTAAGYRQGEQSVYAHLQGGNPPAGSGSKAAAVPDPWGTVVAGEAPQTAAERKAR